MATRYEQGVHDFLREYIPGHTAQEISEAVRARFGIEMTPGQVKLYKNNHHIKSGTKKGFKKDRPSKTFPQEAWDFIRAHNSEMSADELAAALSKELGREYTGQQIKAFRCNHRMPCGRRTTFEPGHPSWNKGRHNPATGRQALTTFKPGHKSWNEVPVGTVITATDGYKRIKISDNGSYKDWMQYARYVWEQENGPIPENHVVLHLDGDKANDDLGNLALVTAAERLMLSRRNLLTDNAEINKTACVLASTMCALYAGRKKIKMKGRKT